MLYLKTSWQAPKYQSMHGCQRIYLFCEVCEAFARTTQNVCWNFDYGPRWISPLDPKWSCIKWLWTVFVYCLVCIVHVLVTRYYSHFGLFNLRTTLFKNHCSAALILDFLRVKGVLCHISVLKGIVHQFWVILVR